MNYRKYKYGSGIYKTPLHVKVKSKVKSEEPNSSFKSCTTCNIENEENIERKEQSSSFRSCALHNIKKDTQNLDISFIRWITPRLEYYLNTAGKSVNLEYDIIPFKCEHEAKLYNIKGYLEEIVGVFNDYLSKNDIDKYFANKIRRARHLLAEILPYLWW